LQVRPCLTLDAILAFKLNAERRHHIPKQKHKVTNSLGALLRSWRDYDASLRQRGSLTVWITEEAIAAWTAEPRTTRGGQPIYSPLAILTALTLHAVFRLALRQTEGLIGSVIGLLGLDLAVLDHSTLSRRAETLEVPRPRSSPGAEPMHLPLHSTGLMLLGAGEWLHKKLNNRLEHHHRGLKGRYRPMLGFKCPRSAARFCRGHDELRNDLRPRTRRNHHVPALRRRMLFLRRTMTVLDIWKLHNGALPRLWGHRLYLLARVLTEPALQPSHQILASGTTRIITPEPDKSHTELASDRFRTFWSD